MNTSTPTTAPTPAQNARDAVVFLLVKIGSWTSARWDQHLRNEFGDEFTNSVLGWLGRYVASELATPDGVLRESVKEAMKGRSSNSEPLFHMLRLFVEKMAPIATGDAQADYDAKLRFEGADRVRHWFAGLVEWVAPDKPPEFLDHPTSKFRAELLGLDRETPCAACAEWIYTGGVSTEHMTDVCKKQVAAAEAYDRTSNALRHALVMWMSGTDIKNRWPCGDCGRESADAPLKGLHTKREDETEFYSGCWLCSFSSGKIEEVQTYRSAPNADDADDDDDDAYSKPGSGSPPSSESDTPPPAALAKREEPEVAATVAKPIIGCPMPDFPEADIRASVVLEAFLTDEQRSDYRRRGAFITRGVDTGRRYMIANRERPAMLKQCGYRQVFDLEDRIALCIHDWAVPPPEEMLALHLLLSMPGHEEYVRNRPETFEVHT